MSLQDKENKWFPKDFEPEQKDDPAFVWPEDRPIVVISRDGTGPIRESPKSTAPVKESILQEADRIVNGDRQADYSDPVKNFKHIAAIASVILNKELTAEDCCVVLMAVKLARESYKHKRDNLVDLAGYTEILHRIKEADVAGDNSKNHFEGRIEEAGCDFCRDEQGYTIGNMYVCYNCGRQVP